MFGFFTYSKRLNNLYCDAVNAWLFLGDQDALEIATNAVLTAEEKQRISMLEYAGQTFELFNREDEEGIRVLLILSGGELADVTAARSRWDILLSEFSKIPHLNLQRARKAMKRDNEKAVQSGDESYFRIRYPNFALWKNPAETK